MKKALSLILVLVMCLSLCACNTSNTSNSGNSGNSGNSSKKTEEIELTAYNFEKYLTVTFEIKNFDEGQLAPDVELYTPTFDLVVHVEAADSDYKFTDTVLNLTLSDKANVTNLDLNVNKIEIVIDENGNGTFSKDSISWTASAVAEPQYEILTAVSDVSGIATKE